MGNERLPSLIIADDSAKPMRLEFDQVLHAVVHPTSDFLALPATDLRLLKAAGGDTRALQFRTGAIGAGPDSTDGSTLKFYLKHNASDQLEIYADNGGSPAGIKITAAGVVSIGGNTVPSILTGTATWNPASIAAGASTTTTITVTGAATTNTPAVVISASIDIEGSGLIMDGRVTSANTVTVRYYNNTSGAVDPASHTVRATVFQY